MTLPAEERSGFPHGSDLTSLEAQDTPDIGLHPSPGMTSATEGTTSISVPPLHRKTERHPGSSVSEAGCKKRAW